MIGLIAAQHVFGHNFSLVYSVLNAFKTNLATAIGQGRAIACGPYMRVRALPQHVGFDAVVNFQTGLFRKVGGRGDADAGDDKIHSQL